MQKSVLEELHKVQVEILDEIVKICDSHKLSYFLIGGTLLGAVRHRGFIPWDDDLDIVMPRNDYEKFLDLCLKELSDNYSVQCYKTDHTYFRTFAKVMKKNTLFVEKLYSNESNLSNKGIFVDIFPLDNASKEVGTQQVQKYLISKLTTIIGVKLKLSKVGPVKTSLSKLVTKKFAIKLQQTIMRWNKHEGSEYFVNLGSHYDVIKQTIPKNKYIPAKKLEFEGKYYYVPGDYEFYLERIFGTDYMELPPEEKRETHDPFKISFNTELDVK